jgi:hypothetical protein
MGSSGAFKASLIKRSKESGESEHLLSLSNYIYYENDNEVSRTFTITKDFIDSLSPGDELELSADGRDENCGYGAEDDDEEEDWDDDDDED